MAEDAEKAAEQTVTEPIQSIEVDSTVQQNGEEKGDDARDGEGSEDDAPGEDDDGAEDNADGKVSNELYRNYKAITEVLLNFKIKLRNNE